MTTRPRFILTIDTEGDNLWGEVNQVTTRNALFLPRFQALCERYQFAPCYLTNYEMAIDPAYQDFARDVIARDVGEIGMHLHAWNSPPLLPLTANDDRAKPYLIEYAEPVMRDKIALMTDLLQDTFGVKMRSHRAGRWAFNATYARLLHEFGYQVDCSVTPGVDWRPTLGNPAGAGGTDYSAFPQQAYWMDLDQLDQPLSAAAVAAGTPTLLQVPMTIRPKYPAWVDGLKQGLNTLRGKTKPPTRRWLRPRGGNAQEMIGLADAVLASGQNHLEFMLHSSEFMPGGSPTFRDEASIEQLYADLEALFAHLAPRCQGQTLAGFYAVQVAGG